MSLKKSGVLLLALLIISFGLHSNSVNAETTTLNFGMLEASGTPATDAIAEVFVPQFEEAQDEYEVEFYPDGALGDTVDVIEQVTHGEAAHIYRAGTSNYDEFADDISIFALNWVFDSNEHVQKFLDSEWMAEVTEELKEEGNLYMPGEFGLRPPRHLLSNELILGPEDIEGLSVRVPAVPLYMDAWSAVGAEPVQVEYGEAYLALQQGAVDAMENPVDAAYGMAFQEVIDYWIEVAHLFNPYGTVVNADIWEEMSPEVQEAFYDALAAAEDWYERQMDEKLGEYRAEMMREEGNIFIEFDTGPLAEQMEPLAHELEEEGEWGEGLFDYIRDLIE